MAVSKAKFVAELKGKEVQKSPPPLNICIVINILYYLKPFSKVIMLAEPLDNIGSDIERSSFLALKQILATLDSGKNDPINIYPFLDKFCHVTSTNLHEFECLDVSFIWDSVIKLITVVIPPLREVFLGRISSSLDIPSWLNLISRCFHAQFLHPTQTLEEVMRATLANYVHDEDDDDDENDDGDEDSETYEQKSPAERIRGFNAKVLYRAPEILVFAVESTHLPLPLRFTDMFTRANGRARPPNAIQFPESFDASVFLNECNIANSKRAPVDESIPESQRETTVQLLAPKWYDLASVVTLEGAAFDAVEAYYRILDREDSQQWLEGSGAHHEVVEKSKVVEGNYFSMTDPRKVHPRLLIYTKRGMSAVLERLSGYVTKAGQMRSLGDATFESAETPEHYDEAKHYYEEAIAYDPNLRPVLQERLTALDLIERNQRAHCYETQADISLGRRRFKEACDLYKSAMRSAVVNSPLYLRIREKEDYMMKIISLEIANHLTEKGQDCLRTGCFAQGKEHFLQAMKLNPSYIHLQTIIAGIDQAITVQTSAQKVAEANQAMKLGKYKQANQLFQESIALIPEREAGLKSVLESLVGLMQGEEALAKQRAGLVALEDRKFILAIDFITEAIQLLPKESVMEHAYFLCDRAQVYFEMKEYAISIEDCNAALALRPDLAMAYLRLGAAQFELERYDEAIDSYEKAIRNDNSLSDQVKVKMRQVNTAKEILQRKEREAERARAQEEQKRLLEERRARDEAAKKNRQQKLLEEKAEKAERTLMRDEEQLMIKFLAALNEAKPAADAAVSATTAAAAAKSATAAAAAKDDKGKGKKEKEKTEKELQKAQERERARQEKEKERERLKLAKEQKAADERRQKEEELQKQREFTAEMERVQNRAKEIEREKEAEREKARLERERLIAEREKAREEKKLAEAKKAKENTQTKPAPAAAAPATPAATAPQAAASTTAPTAPALSVRDPNLDLFPSIFAGAAKVTVKVKGSKEVVVPATPSAAEAPAAPATPSGPQPGAKWSSLLAPPAAPAPSSPAVTNKQPGGQQFNNPYSSANRGRSVPDPANDFPPLGETVGDSYNKSSTAASSSGGFQNDVGFQYGASSAWADHERAMLEATAERISVRDNASAGTTPKPPASSSSSASPAVFVPQAEQRPAAPSLVSSNSASFQPARPAPVAEISPLLSKLGIGASPAPQPLNPAANTLIQRTHLPTENDDHDINLLLSSPLEPLPASPNSDFPPRGVRPNGSRIVDTDLGSLLGGPSTGMGLDAPLGGGFGSGLDAYSSLLGPSTLSNDASLLGGSLFGDPLFGGSRANSGGLSDGDLLGGYLGSSSSSLLSPTTSSALGLGAIGGLSRASSGMDSSAGFGVARPGDFLGGRNPNGTDFDVQLGLNLPPPVAADPLLGNNSLSSLLGYNSGLGGGGMGNDFGGFGGDASGFGGLGFPGAQRSASGSLGFGMGSVPLSRATSSGSSFGGLGGVMQPPQPPMMGLGGAPFGSMTVAPTHNLSSLLDLTGVRSPVPTAANPGTSSSSAPFGIAETTSVGIDNDVVSEAHFPAVAWLRAYQMHMYRWAGNSQEWTDYAMHIPREMYPAVFSEDGSSLSAAAADVSRRSGCRMWKEVEFLRGVSESFLVFHKGSDGQPTHQAMLAALELTSALLRPWIAAALPRSTTPVLSKTPESFLGAVVQPSPSAPTASRVLAATAAAAAAAPAPVAPAAQPAVSSAPAAPAVPVPAEEAGASATRRERPPLLKVAPLQPGGYVQRYLEIPRDVVGLIIGQGGKKIKELCTESGAKIQFRVNKTAEREGRPGMLEVHGSQENVDKAMQHIWDLLQLLGREYNEVPASSVPKSMK